MFSTRRLLSATVNGAKAVGSTPTKTTTGIFGMKVHDDPRPHLLTVYKNTLSVLSQMPQSAVYRQATEALTQQRLSIVEATENLATIEQQLAAGQLEEVIEQAEDEEKLAKKMLDWRAWEDLEEKPPAGQWTYFGAKSHTGP